MRRIILLMPLLALLLALPACNKQIAPEAMPAAASVGDYYYTQFALRYEKGRFRTTNYHQGVFLPINTRVTLKEITRKNILVAIEPSGQELLIENVEKHTGDSVSQAFDKVFARTPVNLSRFNTAERAHIVDGTVAKGMRKAAVIAAIGYPPRIETPSMEGNEWTYWRNRWDKYIVTFKNGVVVDIRT